MHGIVGENGAGKSTLMAILYGFYQADEGSIEFNGQPARIRSRTRPLRSASAWSTSTSCWWTRSPALENVMLGAEGGWLLGPARPRRARLQQLMNDHRPAGAARCSVADLPVGELQRLEILKALYRGARILILDEPTAVLTPQETDQLFVTLRALRDQGHDADPDHAQAARVMASATPSR